MEKQCTPINYVIYAGDEWELLPRLIEHYTRSTKHKECASSSFGVNHDPWRLGAARDSFTVYRVAMGSTEWSQHLGLSVMRWEDDPALSGAKLCTIECPGVEPGAPNTIGCSRGTTEHKGS